MTVAKPRKPPSAPRQAPLPDPAAWYEGPYPERLRAAWRAHLAPKANGAPTVVSLFAGGGGSSLGYSMAGFDERLAVEWDRHACATFRLNFPGVTLHEGDITRLGDGEALRLAGVRPGELDVLDGSPPCQGFSTGGKRDIDDPRNGLFREYVRLLRAFRPRGFVMENVSGLVKGKMRLVFVEMITSLKGAGYRVSARLLDTSYYGVPQARQRVIFVGVRADLGADPSHPRPSAGARAVSVGDAWVGVAREGVPTFTPNFKRLAPQVREGEVAADVDPGQGFQNLVRPRWHRPAPTLTRMNPGNGRGTMIHPKEDRSVSVPEAQRLSSFPDEFRLAPGSFQDRWGKLGNSVPPLFMAAIAMHLRREVFRK